MPMMSGGGLTTPRKISPFNFSIMFCSVSTGIPPPSVQGSHTILYFSCDDENLLGWVSLQSDVMQIHLLVNGMNKVWETVL